MPLGGLFGGSSAANKPQPLSNVDSGREKPGKKETGDKDARGTILKLQNHTVVIDRKLAEGGFAIVYLVTDKQNRHYALKRQFMHDDVKQVEACKRECQIISSLRGHKNIVHYVDHILQRSKNGVYDYMLLTAYYKASVLGLMNDRLAAGKGLTPSEVMNIFCDMCEAVSRLHHSNTPVIHRDLKVENILVDERNRGAPPIFVLCDFGSATTKVLSTETHPVSFIQEEIERYTTLSYRAPEMIDLYSGKPIGTKADTWAMGVMLFKLCYFALPFGDSAMAIQNGAFSFPVAPEYPIEIRAIIKFLLEADIEVRPNIYQTSALAFKVAKRSNPVQNIYKVETPSLTDCVSAATGGRPMRTVENKSEDVQNLSVVPVSQLCSTSDMSSVLPTAPQTTSVNPRLRPKPTNSVPRLPVVCPSPQLAPRSVAHGASVSEPDIPPASSATETSIPAPDSDLGPLSCPLTKPDMGFMEIDEFAKRVRAGTDAAALRDGETFTNKFEASRGDSMHRRNVSDCSTVIKSAFRPYSQTTTTPALSSLSATDVTDDRIVWNPFTEAPYGDGQPFVDGGKMDDARFGQCFDELPRNTEATSVAAMDDEDAGSIDSKDPFGAAPFDAPTVAERRRLRSERERDDSVGSAGDLTRIVQEDSSDMDEVRVASRRRFSYEHIDGVGDDASSDSRARTEDDSNTDDQKLDDDDEEGDNSQTTEGGGVHTDEEGGNRPLLDDDELEQEHDDNDALWVEVNARKCTNPFLCSTPLWLTEKTPVPPQIPDEPFVIVEPDFERRGTLVSGEKQCLPSVAPLDVFQAPATLPRQVTPLFAVQRTFPKCATAASPKQVPAVPPVPTSAPVVSSAPPTSTHMSTTVIEQYAGGSLAGAPVMPPAVDTLIEPLPVGSGSISQRTTTAVSIFSPTKQVAHHPVTVPTSIPSPRTVSTVTRNLERKILPAATLAPTEVGSSNHRKISHEEEKKMSRSMEGGDTFNAVHAIASSSVVTSVPKAFGYSSPKGKKEKKKSVQRRASSSSDESPQTDDSGAEMFTSTSSVKIEKSKKKHKSAFVMRGSYPSVAPTELKLTPLDVQKQQQKRASSSKRGSSGAVNASFVNSSFQAEDLDSPPTLRNTVVQKS